MVADERNVPASCLAGASCADLSASVQAEVAAGSIPGAVSASCSGPSSCRCQELLSVPISGSGTYVTTGTSLTADGVLGDLQYCVQGNSVHLLASTTPG